MLNVLILLFSINVIYSHNHSQDLDRRTLLSDIFDDIEQHANSDSAPNGKVLVKYAPFSRPIAEQAISGRISPNSVKAGISDVMTKLDLSGPLNEKQKKCFGRVGKVSFPLPSASTGEFWLYQRFMKQWWPKSLNRSC